MTHCEERQINVPGFTIAVKIWNPSAEKAVLCFHGKMDNAASFDLLAPLLPDLQLIAVDSPCTGLSSHYPPGVLPHWKNDALLMLHVINALGLKQFDMIGHSLGAIVATFIATACPDQVGKLVFLDILGPTINFIEQRLTYQPRDIETYLTSDYQERSVFPTREAAIQDRMKKGKVSYQAAEALVARGTVQRHDGWVWTVDSRLHCVSLTMPYEDELQALLKAITVPVCLIRAKEGVPYPEATFRSRVAVVKNLIIHEVPGGHHVHMDDPAPVAGIISQFLGG